MVASRAWMTSDESQIEGRVVDYGSNATPNIIAAVMPAESIVIRIQRREVIVTEGNRPPKQTVEISWIQDTSGREPRREKVTLPIRQFDDFDVARTRVGEPLLTFSRPARRPWSRTVGS